MTLKRSSLLHRSFFAAAGGAASIAAAALLGGCASTGSSRAPTATAPVVAPYAAASCDADKARFAMGQVATIQLAAEARARAGATSVRILKPNEVVTLEFNAGRLNLVVDVGNRVTAVRCG